MTLKKMPSVHVKHTGAARATAMHECGCGYPFLPLDDRAMVVWQEIGERLR